MFDQPHTKDEKETPSIANCWRLNEKNEESRDKIKQYTRTLDDDDMVEHLDILDKETQLITEWTTLGTGKYTWAWAGAIKNKNLYCIACFKNFILFLGVGDFIILYCNILKNYYYYSLMCILICVYKIIIMYMGLI